MTPVSVEPPRILTIEDDPVLGAYVREQLEHCGFAVTWCQNGPEGLGIARRRPFDVVLLDILLPGMDGLEVLTHFRQSHSTPVLLMSALGAEADRISGFRLGADDYLAKPFELTELEARVKALLRRSVLGGERQQRCGVLAYDLDTRRFTLGEELLTLTSREQAVLEALIARPGRVMSKEQLASQVFGLDEEASPDAIEIYVHRLRKKLDGHAVAIVTFRGLGYLLESRDA